MCIRDRLCTVRSQFLYLLRETEKASLQIEKLGTDGTELQNRQKEMKAVLEEKQKEYQTTDGAEKEKAETDFRKDVYKRQVSMTFCLKAASWIFSIFWMCFTVTVPVAESVWLYS